MEIWINCAFWTWNDSKMIKWWKHFTETSNKVNLRINRVPINHVRTVQQLKITQIDTYPEKYRTKTFVEKCQQSVNIVKGNCWLKADNSLFQNSMCNFGISHCIHSSPDGGSKEKLPGCMLLLTRKYFSPIQITYLPTVWDI